MKLSAVTNRRTQHDTATDPAALEDMDDVPLVTIFAADGRRACGR
jgi:hypothetical protein